MYRRLEFYSETSPLKTRLYFSVWCTNLSRVRQEMSNSSCNAIFRHLAVVLVVSYKAISFEASVLAFYQLQL